MAQVDGSGTSVAGTSDRQRRRLQISKHMTNSRDGEVEVINLDLKILIGIIPRDRRRR